MLRQIKFATGDISLFPLIREGTLTFIFTALKEVQTRCLRLGDWSLLAKHSNKDSSQKQRKAEAGRQLWKLLSPKLLLRAESPRAGQGCVRF